MAKTKEEINAQRRQYYAENRESNLARRKPYADAHRKERCAYAKIYQKEHSAERKADPEFRKKQSEWSRNWRTKNNIKSRAVAHYNKTVREGKIPRITVCIDCGATDNLQAHHFSYAREHWLHVVPLCRDCHKRVHRGVSSVAIDAEIQRLLSLSTVDTDDIVEPGVEWRDITSMPFYQVSNTGRVRRLEHWVERSKQTTKFWAHIIPKEIKLYRTKLGYYIFSRYKINNKTTSIGVHSLVLLAFVGQPGLGQECRHLDNNPSNNNLSNLVWGTRFENYEDRVKRGTAFLFGKQYDTSYACPQTVRAEKIEITASKIALS